MNHTIRIDFHDEDGLLRQGELMNSFRIIESVTSPVGLAVDIDASPTGEVSVLVFWGAEMQAHCVDMRRVIAAEEVQV